MSIRTRPILFSGSMVRAILEGTKTQTRRIMKPQPDSEPTAIESVALTKTNSEGVASPGREVFGAYGDDWFCKCPYGAPGDRLWVRETCKAEELPSGLDGVRYAADGAFREIENTQEASDRWGSLYCYGVHSNKNVPSIHMPRWASRITLEITDVSVERLKEISVEDVKSEGYPGTDVDGKHIPWSPIGWYMSVWESINGVGSWEKNPWVWVVSFERVDS